MPPPKDVPLWALGPWMSSNNWDSDAEVRKQVALSEEHGIPATVLVITVKEVFLHCAKAVKRSRLWDDAARTDRSRLPTMGQTMLK